MEQEKKYIYQVYQDGSFSKAAESLYMTQPALSLAVRRVEAGIGAPLFDRSRHPLVLTDAGKAYIAAIREISHLEESLSRQIQDLQSLHTGTLRIGGTHYVNCYLLADILSAFSARYPGVRVELLEDSSTNVAKALQNREVDLIFSCDENLIARFPHSPAFCDRILLAVPEKMMPDSAADAALSSDDILAGKHLREVCPKADLQCFRGLPMILLNEGSNLRSRSLAMLADAGVTPNVKMTLAQMVTAFRMAQCGLGAAFASDRLVTMPADNLRYFVIDSPLINRQFCILLPEQGYIPQSAKIFSEFVREFHSFSS